MAPKGSCLNLELALTLHGGRKSLDEVPSFTATFDLSSLCPGNAHFCETERDG